MKSTGTLQPPLPKEMCSIFILIAKANNLKMQRELIIQFHFAKKMGKCNGCGTKIAIYTN